MIEFYLRNYRQQIKRKISLKKKLNLSIKIGIDFSSFKVGITIIALTTMP